MAAGCACAAGLSGADEAQPESSELRMLSEAVRLTREPGRAAQASWYTFQVLLGDQRSREAGEGQSIPGGLPGVASVHVRQS